MLLPTKACFAPDEPVRIELAPNTPAGRLLVEHLGSPVAAVDVAAGQELLTLPALPEGGYAVALRSTDGTPVAYTAVEVLDAAAG